MKSNLFKYIAAIPRITKLLSNQKIDVKISGKGAYTIHRPDGSIQLINLPSLPDNASAKTLNLTFGYMFHELGHVYHTDSKVNAKYGIQMKSELGTILNMVEDTYVERKIRGQLLEAGKYLTYCQNEVKSGVEKMLQSPEITKEQRIANGLIGSIRYYSGQIEFEDVVKNNPIPELAFMPKYEEKLKNISSTEDSLEVATKILEELKKQGASSKSPDQNKEQESQSEESQEGENSGNQSKSPSKNKPENKDSKGKKSKDKSSGQKSDETEKEDKSDKEDSENSDNDSDNSDSDNSDSDNNDSDNNDSDNNDSDNSDSDNSDSDEDSNEEDSKDIGKALAEAIQEAAEANDAFSGIKGSPSQPNGNEKNIIRVEERDAEYTCEDRSKDEIFTFNSDYDNSVIEKMIPDSNVTQLSNRLYRLFMSKKKKNIIKGKRSGKLCCSNLHKLRVDDNRVFTHKSEVEGKNTAVTLLVDLSGSMHGDRHQCAVSAAYLFCSVLERLRIPCEVLGFSTGGISVGNVGRRENITLGIFKSFSEKTTPETSGRFCHLYKGNSSSKVFRNNDDGEAILMSLGRLANRPEERKIMFVFSDGQPNCHTSNGCEYKHLVNVVKDIEQDKRYEIYAVGIQTESVKKFYSNYSVIDKPEELSNVIVTQLTKKLI